ncbi:hypothetical protein [Melaminivora sp.]|uniref:hypothetical protein n=1 Tax=Melaminivora sp. TaxID=1933032 RepID=UPI0028A84DCC|nr:hypothetical protein [Melaminivora sp.]
MNTQSRLTLENGANDNLLSRLEYTLSSGEKIVMEIPLPKIAQGAGSRTIQEVEMAILQRTKEICSHMLDGLRKEP